MLLTSLSIYEYYCESDEDPSPWIAVTERDHSGIDSYGLRYKPP